MRQEFQHIRIAKVGNTWWICKSNSHHTLGTVRLDAKLSGYVFKEWYSGDEGCFTTAELREIAEFMVRLEKENLVARDAGQEQSESRPDWTERDSVANSSSNAQDFSDIADRVLDERHAFFARLANHDKGKETKDA